jgi:hypothetical protein
MTSPEQAVGRYLKDAVHGTLPCGPTPDLLTLLVNGVPVEFTATSVDVHLSGSEPTFFLPEVTGDPEGCHNEESKIGLEEL